MTYFGILIGGLLVSNFIFARFLGICPFLGVSKKLETAAGMSMAVIFVITVASMITWLFNQFILVPLGLEFLMTVSFILVIASLVQFVEMVIMKVSPVLYQALGIYLPLITTNCAVLGAAILNVRSHYGFLEAVVAGFAAACGWSLAILLFAGIRERLELSDIPEVLKGFPIALISTGLMAMSFVGFQGLFQELLH
ncbi:MAG: electron transport complex subunit RsxA [Bacillota bacterium]|jgi:electron transport complex protein RnfA